MIMTSSSWFRTRRVPAAAWAFLLVAVLASALSAVLVAGPAGAEPAGSARRQVAAASLDAGGAHTCVVLTTGAVRCWGNDSAGQLGHDSAVNIGDGTVSIRAAGDVPLGGKALALAAGTLHTCAVLVRGAVRCWGYGGNGQLGYGNTSTVGDPSGPSILEAGDVPMGLAAKATAIAGGVRHTCALLTTGAVRCWGEGTQGELGHNSPASIGDDPSRSIELAGDVPLGGKASAITAGDSFTCALLTTGRVRCWGYGGYGQLGHNSAANVGDGNPAGQSIEQAGNVPLTGKVTAIAAGAHHVCGLMSTGAVRCWGDAFAGQLGYDSKAIIGDGTGVLMQDLGDVPLGGKAVAITAGGNHTCALLSTGGVRCWGDGVFGELGYGNTTSVGDGSGPSIKQAGDVPLGARAVAVSAGDAHTCALLSTGAVRCWGDGNSGRLGYGNPDNVGDGFGTSIKHAGDVPVGVPVRSRAATSLTVTTSPTRDRHAPYDYVITGRVRGAFAADAATCTGQVRVDVRRGARLLRTRTRPVDSRCRYRVRLRITGRRLPVHTATRLAVRIHYLGTANLKPARASGHLTAH